MGPRLVFTLSLVVAGGLHALILLVPRSPGQIDARVPTVELTLEYAETPNAGGNPGPAPVSRDAASTRAAAAAAVPLPTQAPASAAFPAAEAPSDPNDAAALPVTMGPAAGPSGPGDQAPVSRAGAGTEAGRAGTGGTDDRAYGTAAAFALSPPRPKAEILPTYPRSARKAALEGIVRIAAFIDESGVVVSAEVLTSSGHRALDQAALQAVRRTFFEPALQAGRSVPFRLIIPVRFKLN
jgi:protein TonB